MKGTNRDGTADERVERLIDEELQRVLDAPPVDLRAKVLRAIEGQGTRDGELGTRDEGRGTRDEGRGTRRERRAIFQPRWAFALAASFAAVVLAVVLSWRGSVKPAPHPQMANRGMLASAPVVSAAAHLVAPPIVPGSRVVATAASRGPRRVLVPDTMTVDAQASASNEPYMPGAPAGDLGDPLQPLPLPPPVSFAPIDSAPPVSTLARPVTDFPADNTSPAADSGNAGPSGGTRR